MTGQNNTIAAKEDSFEFRAVESDAVFALMLDNLQSERDALIMRVRHLETVLMKHGRISRRAVVSRGDSR